MVDVEVEGLRFYSAFDSGNLSSADVGSGPDDFILNVSSDCSGSSHETAYRSWFFFAVTFVGPSSSTPPRRVSQGQQSRRVTFTIANLSGTNKIFDFDNRPVYRSSKSGGRWDRLSNPLTMNFVDRKGSSIPGRTTASAGPPSAGSAMSYVSSRKGSTQQSSQRQLSRAVLKISWTFTFSTIGETVEFATCYPYQFSELLDNIDRWQATHGTDADKEAEWRNAQQATNVSEDEAPAEATVPTTPVEKVPRRPSRVPPRRPAPPAKASRIDLASRKESQAPIYFVRETLCYSLENRRVDLLTITNMAGMASTQEDYHSASVPVRSAGVSRPFEFPGKQIILVSARVHPGEVPGSHVMHGLIEFLLNVDDPRASLLRDNFVFKLIPMLNPDGVAQGHYRTDSRGVNLNRVYAAPDITVHPTIHATRELFLSIAKSGKLYTYIDLHAHASKRGCFVFGNAWEDTAVNVQNLLFPKLMSMNTMHFHFPSCDFTSRSMVTKNQRDGMTKEGTGRVALAVESGLVHSYTMEVSYNMGVAVNNIIPLDLPGESYSATPSQPKTAPQGLIKYSPSTYFDVGRAIGVSLLDMYGANTFSRLPMTPLQSLGGVKNWLDKQIKMLHDEQARLEVESCYSSSRRTQRSKKKTLERAGDLYALPTMNIYRSASDTLTPFRRNDGSDQDSD